MKVKELLEALATADPDAEVILQKDAEGNGYSPLSCADLEAVYIPESTYSGTVYSMGWSANDADMSELDWGNIKSKPRCVVLAPVS
jgi:hypothetical protein